MFQCDGSLSMLIIDKRDDVVTLRNLGASDRQIVRIFLFEGRMISFSERLQELYRFAALLVAARIWPDSFGKLWKLCS